MILFSTVKTYDPYSHQKNVNTRKSESNSSKFQCSRKKQMCILKNSELNSRSLSDVVRAGALLVTALETFTITELLASLPSSQLGSTADGI